MGSIDQGKSSQSATSGAKVLSSVEQVRTDRTQTDKSLRSERATTDQALNSAIPSTQKLADETIALERRHTDQAIEADRRETDRSIDVVGKTKTGLTAEIERERARTSELQETERRITDAARDYERVNRDFVHFAVLGQERAITDEKLLRERVATDDTLSTALTSLTSEQAARIIARAAIVARDEILGIVSHDLRNPLTVIALNANQLAAENSSDEACAKNDKKIRAILRSVSTMQRLLDDLTDIESIAFGKLAVSPTRNDMTTILRESVDHFTDIAKSKSIALIAEVPAEPVCALADRERILQVLSNLLSNALKYTPAEGKILVREEVRSDTVCVSVADTGVGIAKDQQDRVFDRFSQIHRVGRQSLGLGLYIARAIIEAHRGRIWVESNVGKGSVFYFTLPLA